MSKTGSGDPLDPKVNYYCINVFKYNREQQSLELIWAGKGPPALHAKTP